MNKQEIYPAKNYLSNKKARKNKAQASIEFSIAFVLALLFMILSCNLFVWLNHNIVRRQRAYEDSRFDAANINTPGKLDFYTPKEMNLLSPGGYE